jgi:hypothetical protein
VAVPDTGVDRRVVEHPDVDKREAVRSQFCVRQRKLVRPGPRQPTLSRERRRQAKDRLPITQSSAKEIRRIHTPNASDLRFCKPRTTGADACLATRSSEHKGKTDALTRLLDEGWSATCHGRPVRASPA